jgi:hypothetical protein
MNRDAMPEHVLIILDTIRSCVPATQTCSIGLRPGSPPRRLPTPTTPYARQKTKAVTGSPVPQRADSSVVDDGIPLPLKLGQAVPHGLQLFW